MQKLDFYTRMKMDLVMMNINGYNSVVDIVALPLYCPWIMNDDNLNESFSRLVDIHNQNMDELNTFMKYVRYLDDSCSNFSLDDLNDEYEFIKDNMNLQDEYYDNMLSYINFCDDYSNPWTDVAKFCSKYCDTDDQIFDQVQVNHSLIKSIREERKNKIE